MVFSEFETGAPFDRVAEWVDPSNWVHVLLACASRSSLSDPDHDRVN